MEPLETQRYDRAFVTLPEPTLLLDEAGEVLLVNAAGESLLGTSAQACRDETVARAMPWLGPPLARVLAGEDEVAFEAKLSTPEGPRCVAARLRRVRERGGTPCGVLAVLEDVTERRALEAQQRSAARIAAIGTLAAGLAHEVNNPLACVVAGLSFLETEHARIASALAPAELVEAKLALEEARDAALRVGRIVHSLQSLGRPATPLLQEIDLADVVRAAMRLAQADLRGRACIDADIRSVKARTSESLLVEVFLALLVDAARVAEPDAPVRALRVRLAADLEAGCAVVSVSGPRTRGSSPGGPRASLVGDASLSFSHGVVTALGGTLSMDRAPGGGSTATVRLPLGPA